MRTELWLILVPILISGCTCNSLHELPEPGISDTTIGDYLFVDSLAHNVDSATDPQQPDSLVQPKPGPLEQSLITAGLVNIQQLDSTILVDLKYSTTDNFLGLDVYEDLTNCYLQPDVAEMLAQAQQFLKEEHPELTLLVYDGVRPRSIQQKMWQQLDSIPVKERTRYVSNPKNGSLHNFGAAVDLTIADTSGVALDMGTPFDYFGELAFPRLEWELVEQGKLTREVVDNRSLLRAVMVRAGFANITTEWWHFNACKRAEAKERYSIVE